MDWILQKATELGVAAFVPVNSERSEVRLDAERTAKRVAHWRGVVASACGQSGRARLPAISTPLPLSEATATLPAAALRLTLDPGAELALKALSAPASATVVVAIGPEGGWSPRDREQLASAGFGGVRLGPRILRTETAGIAAISALQAAFGDLG
jgi:16S rRNA (uracil1498-N3)-methyltransferase